MTRIRGSRSYILVLAAAMVAALCAGAARAELIYGISDENQLFTFDSVTPGIITSAHFITGIRPAEQVLAIDFDPVTFDLFALGSSSRVYKLDRDTAVATPVADSFTPILNGLNFGIEWTTDGIQVVSDLGQNLLVDAGTGQVTVNGTDLAFAAGDANAGKAATVSALAATDAGELYGIDYVNQALVRVDPATGELSTVGATGEASTGEVGFDISLLTGTGFVSQNWAEHPKLFVVDLATGDLTSVGVIWNEADDLEVRDIAVYPVPEPATIIGLAGGLIGMAIRRSRRAA